MKSRDPIFFDTLSKRVWPVPRRNEESKPWIDWLCELAIIIADGKAFSFLDESFGSEHELVMMVCDLVPMLLWPKHEKI